MFIDGIGVLVLVLVFVVFNLDNDDNDDNDNDDDDNDNDDNDDICSITEVIYSWVISSLLSLLVWTKIILILSGPCIEHIFISSSSLSLLISLMILYPWYIAADLDAFIFLTSKHIVCSY